MIIAFFIICWFLTITFFCWLYYCIHHSFEIILQGLRRAYWVWTSHLALLILITVCWNVRPSWQPHPRDFLYDNEWVCKIWGKIQYHTCCQPFSAFFFERNIVREFAFFSDYFFLDKSRDLF